MKSIGSRGVNIEEGGKGIQGSWSRRERRGQIGSPGRERKRRIRYLKAADSSHTMKQGRDGSEICRNRGDLRDRPANFDGTSLQRRPEKKGDSIRRESLGNLKRKGDGAGHALAERS